MSMAVDLPGPLPEAPRLGIVTCSSPAPARYPARWSRALEFMRNQGVQPVPGRLSDCDQGHRSGTARSRADEFNAFIHDATIDGIISASGGYNCNGLLPYLDFAALAERRVPVVGFSDFTCVLLATLAKSRLACYYGPSVVPTLGDLGWNRVASFEHMVAVLRKPGHAVDVAPFSMWTNEYLAWDIDDDRPRRCLSSHGWRVLRDGYGEGVLLGGNLDTLCAVVGTDFWPVVAGSILMIEEAPTELARFERNLTQLALHGVMDDIRGVVVGRFEALYGGTPEQAYRSLLEVLGDRQVPVIADVDVGHTSPIRTVPLGLHAQVSTTPPALTIGSER